MNSPGAISRAVSARTISITCAERRSHNAAGPTCRNGERRLSISTAIMSVSSVLVRSISSRGSSAAASSPSLVQTRVTSLVEVGVNGSLRTVTSCPVDADHLPLEELWIEYLAGLEQRRARGHGHETFGIVVGCRRDIHRIPRTKGRESASGARTRLANRAMPAIVNKNGAEVTIWLLIW